MWNVPTEKQLAKIPKLYSTEKTPTEEKIVHMHFFLGSWEWYVTEYNAKEELFFGLVKGFETELGYFSLGELKEVKVNGFIEVDRDIYWKPKKIKEIK